MNSSEYGILTYLLSFQLHPYAGFTGPFVPWVLLPPWQRTGVPCSCLDFFFFPPALSLAMYFYPPHNSKRKRKVKVKSLSAQSCPTLCNPMDCSPPGYSVHLILQARILEWVAISFSRGSSWPRDQTWVSRIAGRCFLTSEPPGKPLHPTQAFTNSRVLLILIPLKGMSPSALTLP